MFALNVSGAAMDLVVSVPEQHRAVLDGLAERATAARAAAAGPDVS